jgi:hypothetical protein
MKSFLKAAAILVAVAGVAWLGGYLYWHIRLVGAIHTLEARTGPQGTDQDAYDALHDAGCRAIPYLVGSIQGSKNPNLQSLATALMKASLQGPISRGDREIAEKLSGWLINPDDSAAERQKKADEIQAWWREHGEPRHSRWRWWTGDCGGI